MQPRFEKVHFGDASFLVFERRAPVLNSFWHYHPEFQITLMVEGHGRRFVGDAVGEYGPGDLILLGPNLPHTWQSETASRAASSNQYAVDVQFRADLLADPFFRTQELQPIASLLRSASPGLAFADTAARRRAAGILSQMPSLSSSRRAIRILELLLDLAQEPNADVLSSPFMTPDELIGRAAGSDAMCAYLVTHFEQPINFVAMARHFRRSQASLCRVFKRNTGRTISAYVNELRVNAAARLLISTDQSLAEIAFDSGFGNYSHFHHQFKRLKGKCPRELRNSLAGFLRAP